MVEERDPGPGKTWVEVGVQTNGEGAEAVSALFNRHGTGGAVVSTEFECGSTGAGDAEGMGLVTVKTYSPAGTEGTQACKVRL